MFRKDNAVMKPRVPDFEELKKLAEEGRCLNCGQKTRVMNPLYANPRGDITIDIKKRFTTEQQQFLFKNAGICIVCSAWG